jgi:hypothetical protein
MTAIEGLIASWRRVDELHTFVRGEPWRSEGATAAQIEDFEARVGWTLPPEWRELYSFANGLALFRIMELYPLFGAQSLLEGSEYWRARKWTIPEELWIAGWSEGEGEWSRQFGLWLPSATQPIAPVVEIRIDGGMSVVGSSLSTFLLARTIYFHILDDAPETAFDALGVPDKLRRDDSEGGWAAISTWADPTLPGGDHALDQVPLDADRIRALLGKPA